MCDEAAEGVVEEAGMNVDEQMGQAEIPAGGSDSSRPGLVEIDTASEPLRRNWASMEKLFREDREALRRKDAIACAALEMAESMDKFLNLQSRS
jgi:hypothetical protein